MSSETLNDKAHCDRLGKHIVVCDFECHTRRPEHHGGFVDQYDYSRCQHIVFRNLVVPLDVAQQEIDAKQLMIDKLHEGLEQTIKARDKFERRLADLKHRHKTKMVNYRELYALWKVQKKKLAEAQQQGLKLKGFVANRPRGLRTVHGVSLDQKEFYDWLEQLDNAVYELRDILEPDKKKLRQLAEGNKKVVKGKSTLTLGIPKKEGGNMNDKNPATSIQAAILHHKKHGDMDSRGHCLLNECALHFPKEKQLARREDTSQ